MRSESTARKPEPVRARLDRLIRERGGYTKEARRLSEILPVSKAALYRLTSDEGTPGLALANLIAKQYGILTHEWESP